MWPSYHSSYNDWCWHTIMGRRPQIKDDLYLKQNPQGGRLFLVATATVMLLRHIKNMKRFGFVCVCVCAHVFRHLCSSIRGLGAWGFCSSSASSWDWLFWTKTSDAVPRIDWSQSQFVGHSQSDPVTTSSTDAFLLLISSPAPASNPTGFGCSSAP